MAEGTAQVYNKFLMAINTEVEAPMTIQPLKYSEIKPDNLLLPFVKLSNSFSLLKSFLP